MSTKKLDEALGLGENGIDGFLQGINLGETQDKLQDIDSAIKTSVEEIDTQIQEYNQNGVQSLDITKLDSSFSEMKDLINVSKMTIKHVYDQIVSSELQDPELIQAFSKLIESTHITLSEYVNMYKSRMDFYDKVRIEQLKQKHKLEQMKYKHELDMEKLNSQQKQGAIETPNLMGYSQEDMVKEMSKEEN